MTSRCRIICLSAALLAQWVANGVAFAADLPPATFPVPELRGAIAPFQWTGAYIGATAGYALDRYAFPFGVGTPTGVYAMRGAIFSSGALGGLQAGYAYQTPWRVVVGVEADLLATGVSGDLAFAGAATSGVGVATGVISTRLHGLASFRMRVGYAFDRLLGVDDLLVYLTGGAALGKYDNAMRATMAPALVAYNQSTTRGGFSGRNGTAGVGLEKAFGRNISLQAEYRYTWLGSNYTNASLFPGVTAGFGTRTMYHLGRISANWWFGDR